MSITDNLPSLPDRRAASAPDAPCVADDNASLTNAEFLVAVQIAASTLHRHGVTAGDVVAVMLPNTADLVVTLFAAWRLGAAVTPLNPTLSAEEAGYQITDADAKVLVLTDARDFGVRAAVITAHDLTAGSPSPEIGRRFDENALALLIYTSGTTGRPKGVMLDHANLNAMCQMVIEAFGLTEADHSLLILPLFHVNGIVVSMLSPLLAGGQADHRGTVRPHTFFDLVERRWRDVLLGGSDHLHHARRSA